MEYSPGKDFALPLVAELGIIRRHAAQRIPWHAHAGCQLLFVLRGATAYEFKRGGGERVDLPGGHFLVIPPRVMHRAVQEVRPPCALCHLVLSGPAKGAWRNTPFTRADWQELEHQFRRAPLVVRPLGLELRRAVTNLAHEVQAFARRRPDPLGRARLRTRVCEVLLGAAGQLSITTHPVALDAITAAEDYLRRHLSEGLLMADVAKHLGVTRARLFEMFKRGTGMTPNDFLLQARIKKARELLLASDRTVTDIAFETGFSSSQYFSTVFRKYTGQAPVAFRQKRG